MKVVRAPVTELGAEECTVLMGKVKVTLMLNMERVNFKGFFFPRPTGGPRPMSLVPLS